MVIGMRIDFSYLFYSHCNVVQAFRFYRKRKIFALQRLRYRIGYGCRKHVKHQIAYLLRFAAAGDKVNRYGEKEAVSLDRKSVV